MSGCFIIGKMKGLTLTQFRYYSECTSIFNKVQAYNANVSTLRAQGQTGLSYYQFKTSEEGTKFTQGRFLLVQNDPGNAASYDLVEQN
jgi:hypothetical protein